MAKVLDQKKVGGTMLRLVQGDITERPVDAIVNAANSFLQHGGGVAAAIVRKGGEVIQEESNRIGYLDVGKAAITGAGSLRAKHVIHAVGPRMGEGNENEKLISAVRSALELAEHKGLQSISIPAISSGIFGFPKDRCAAILVVEAALHLRANPTTSLKVVEFCVFDEATAEHFSRELKVLQ